VLPVGRKRWLQAVPVRRGKTLARAGSSR